MKSCVYISGWHGTKVSEASLCTLLTFPFLFMENSWRQKLKTRWGGKKRAEVVCLFHNPNQIKIDGETSRNGEMDSVIASIEKYYENLFANRIQQRKLSAIPFSGRLQIFRAIWDFCEMIFLSFHHRRCSLWIDGSYFSVMFASNNIKASYDAIPTFCPSPKITSKALPRVF